MPIITPAYPSMCATHNVTDSTRDIMLHEFSRTGEIADKISIGIAQWHSLFQESDFFQIYNHYLQIVASSYTAGTQLLEWSGLVESRIRSLVLKLELVDLLQLAHPYIKGIEKVHYCLTDQECWDVAHGVFEFPKRAFPIDGKTSEKQHIESMKLSPQDIKSIRKTYTTTFYIGLKVKPITDESPGPRKLNLVWPTTEFLKSAKMWSGYDQKTMGITLKNLKG